MPTRMDQLRRWEERQLVRHMMTGAVWLLVLSGCAGHEVFRSEVPQMGTDQNSQNAALAALAERLDAVERRLNADAQATEQLRQELKVAVEVLLKKALVTDNRLASLESALTAAKPSEKVVQPAKRRESAVNGVVEPRAPRLSLGMTQEDVRRILGDPINAERAGEHIFWYYSRLKNQGYVVFEQSNGRVSGWLGL